MNKNELIQCFYDSVNISEHILKSETEKAIKSNKVYKENFVARKKNVKQVHKDIFNYLSVESNASFNAAKKYLQYGKTAVLNFANPHYPGGGVHNGAMAQEECLCRSSNLYPCISNKNVFNDYYLYHKDMNHYFFSDRLIYTKSVTVFKDDSDVPQIMPKSEWFNIDVITCAAPYIAKREYTNKTALKELFKGRIKNIFEAAIDNDVEVIILGAFGCGAFKNSPEVVAKAFHEVIDENSYGSYFKKIVFAIPKGNNFYRFDDEFFGEYHTTLLETPLLPLIEPLNKKCKENSQFLFDYDAWKWKNKYYGKQFSILGDSISTIAGYNPKDYKVFYADENCEKSGVKEMQDTWWGKVIDFFGGELLANNSWSGSRVTRLPNNEKLFPSGCSDERTGKLHINNVKPDVVIVYLGTNDWAFGAELDGTRLLSDELNMQYFAAAYETMLEKIKANYPNAEIWCCTLNTTFMSSNPSFKFPYKYGGTYIEKYNQIIKDTADMNNCKIIDLYSYHIPYDSIDGSHPNADGMNTLATLIIREIGGKEIKQFMDFENEIDIEKFKSIHCPHCGKEIKSSGSFCSYCGSPLDEDITGGKHTTIDELREFDNDKSKIKKNDTSLIFDSDAEYVYLPPGRTVPLDGFSNTIRLFDTNTNETIEIQKAKFDVGRNPKCEISIDDNNISRIHVSFYYEKSSWFIMDKDSKNGTYLNGKRLEHNTKYELYPDDIISFAQSKNYVFFKTKSETYQENELIIILEKAIKDFSCDSSDNINILKVIALIMARIPVYFPMDYDFNEMFGNIDPAKLKIGDTITSTNDVKMKMLTLQVPNGEELIPMFTSDEQAHKGPSANLTRLYPPDYLPIVISMNKSIIINPFDENNITIKTAFLKDIVLPIVQEKLKNANEIKDENHDDIKAGTVLDNKYELLKQIGSGGLSTVYLARDIRLNKMWAVKVVKDKRNNQSNPIFNSVIQEAQMMKSFSHPAIPNIVDIVVCQNFVAIVMDYVEGETLETIVKEYGAQPVDRVVDWAKQICDVLGYLHSQNPPHIYRDMKPSNVILQPNGSIKIVDFGLMRTYKPNQNQDTCNLGTQGYAAPEQYGGRGQSDARTDIYGLGMTMYHLLTGIDPKETDFAVKPIRQINPSLPKGLEYIVEKCTQIDPANRYQSCAELQNDLNRYEQLLSKKSFFNKIFKH